MAMDRKKPRFSPKNAAAQKKFLAGCNLTAMLRHFRSRSLLRVLLFGLPYPDPPSETRPAGVMGGAEPGPAFQLLN
jgi:hypothetical protein